MTVRKNFLFDDEVAKHLEEIAKAEGKTQTQIAQEAIEKEYKAITKKKKLKALESLAGSLTGKIGDLDIHQVRIERALHRAK
jgi:predicted transcriptional regulator